MTNRGDTTLNQNANAIRAALYKSIGWTYTSPGKASDIISSLKKWRMISAKSGTFEYHGNLSGIGSDGQAFRIVDISDTDMPGRTAGFSGVIISFKQAKAFTGRSIIAVDKGVYNPTTIDLMQRVPFGDAKFESVFEVYSDQRDEAEALFTSGLVQKMTRFSREALGRKVQACCMGEEVHFALEIEEKFSFSNTPKHKSAPKFVRDLVIEAGSICVILEQLYCIQASLAQTDSAEDKKKRLAYYEKCLSKMMDVAHKITAPSDRSEQAA